MAGLLDFMPSNQNWLERGLNNPLTHIGLGLAQSMAPRYSTNVADLNNGGIPAGLLSGIGSYNQHMARQQNQALKGGLLQAKQQEAELKRKKLEAELGEHERLKMRAMTLLSGLPTEMQQKLAPLAETAPEEFISQVGGLLGAKPDKGPGSWEEYIRAYPNQEISYDQFLTLDANRKRPTTSVTNVMPGGTGGLNQRPVREEEFPLVPRGGNPDDYVVDLKKGQVVPKGEAGKPTVDEARAVQFAAQMDDAKNNLATYEGDLDWRPGTLEYAAPSSLLGVPAKNLVGSDKYKEYYGNAARWAASYIYLVSGATARKEEVDSTVREYFRTPGDSKKQVEQKIAARAVAEREAKARGGRFAKRAVKPRKGKMTLVPDK